ncbi:hypothetical protein GCM10007298_30420 [Williamsia phyllosphaerae]|uniref:Cellulase (Glycosyl hydrolase family 5) n=2 Tax=Williamsia phyllosphaerae TaxID=885042 RepID=A0ABQ1V1N9_9NOCA|nr:hypothetical protein GCM10007298_30420 [Williamsia phyllosphaerae]
MFRMSRLSLRTLITGLILAVTLGFSTVPSASAAPLAPSAGYGFSGGADLLALSQGDLNRELDAVAATGARWLRVGVDRSQIETGPGVYNWSTSDRVINAARARGLTVLAVIAYTPLLQGGGLLRTAPPANVNDFAVFTSRAAQRYQGRVSNWEIWNEPNLPLFFGNVPNPALKYTQLLRAAYPAIKRVQPRATVIAAGLSRQIGALSPPAFINAMYRYGAKGFFDAAAMHPYTFPGGLRANQENGISDIAVVHGIMSRNGDGGKKIWFTEFGAPTNGPRFGGNTPIQQRDQIRDTLAFLARLPYSGPAFIYSIRDTAGDPQSLANRETRFGALLTYDYKRKPTFDLLRR